MYRAPVYKAPAPRVYRKPAYKPAYKPAVRRSYAPVRKVNYGYRSYDKTPDISPRGLGGWDGDCWENELEVCGELEVDNCWGW